MALRFRYWLGGVLRIPWDLEHGILVQTLVAQLSCKGFLNPKVSAYASKDELVKGGADQISDD